ncbi:diacylglycerol acyltransferase [Trypanosoma theileri]|uniref:diacylglycerol O-acyltransferase n=1 Tax=Trypanosoma theileri TaxID=67003 RepID=A0A1X0NY96_9TRYP|nr:diacylglycerol acyltransferase [Trypanosoma theileri]ORC89654.1 diacylglycerol acyltransferase [Trypanosoma theileri]
METVEHPERAGQDATLPPLTVEEMHEQLELILRACGDLQTLMRNRLPITLREVSKLRKAFSLATGESSDLCSRSSSVCSSSDGSSRCSGSVPSTDTEDSRYSRPEFCGPRGLRRRRGLAAQRTVIKETMNNNKKSDNNNNNNNNNKNSFANGQDQQQEEEQQQQQPSPRSLAKSIARWDTRVIVCDRLLKRLEEYARTRPEAHTFDLITTYHGNRKHSDSSISGVNEEKDGGNHPNHDKKNNNHNNNSMTTEMDGNTNTKRNWLELFKIPLERRIQTFVVSLFLFFTFIPFSFLLTLFLLTNLYTMPFMVAYLVYIFTIGRPKHPLKRNQTFTHLKLWQYYSDYFPVRLVIPRYVRRQFDSSKNYFFIYHPHGIHGFGAIAKFTLNDAASALLPGIHIHTQTLKMNFYVPFWRELACLSGSGDASADCIRRTLRSGPGESVLLVVGGAQESLLAKPNTNELTLQRRKGFVRIALQEGTPLVPVYAFGENDVYRIPRMAESQLWKRVERVLRKCTTFAIPLFVGRGWFNYGFGILPHRRPIVVVVGEPLIVPKIPNPTEEELQEWHDKYVWALQQLFNDHHGVYGVESSSLRIH